MAGWLATLAQDIFFGGAAAAAADDRVVAPELEDTDSPYPLLLLYIQVRSLTLVLLYTTSLFGPAKKTKGQYYSMMNYMMNYR